VQRDEDSDHEPA